MFWCFQRGAALNVAGALRAHCYDRYICMCTYVLEHTMKMTLKICSDIRVTIRPRSNKWRVLFAMILFNVFELYYRKKLKVLSILYGIFFFLYIISVCFWHVCRRRGKCYIYNGYLHLCVCGGCVLYTANSRFWVSFARFRNVCSSKKKIVVSKYFIHLVCVLLP